MTEQMENNDNAKEVKSEGGGCPMKRADGGYTMNPLAYFRGKKNPHLSNPKAPSTDAAPAPAATTADADAPASGGGCPVKSSSPSSSSSSSSSSGGGGCPVKSSSQQQYNVYSQPIDPKNQMPASPHSNLPSPFQTSALSNERVSSNIPKGGTDDGTTWTYPSPQMFYNSLVRKNKLGDTTEEDLESVVALHNNMNEKTWHKVMQWEDILNSSSSSDENNQSKELGGGAKLSRFQGRPSDLSPKAYFKHYILGHPLPFDRHDWVIVRPSDGKEQRYVIDYYYDESRAKTTQESALPKLDDMEAVQSILVDVRPAVDGWQSVLQRAVLMPLARRGLLRSAFSISSDFQPLPLQPTSVMKTQVNESLKVWENIQDAVRESKMKQQPPKSMVLPASSVENDDDDGDESMKLSKEEAKQVASDFSTLLKNCNEARQLMNECQSEDECAKASLALTMCMAQIVCPLQHEAMVSSLNAEYDEDKERDVMGYNSRVEAALENVATCVQGNDVKVKLAKRDYPELFS